MAGFDFTVTVRDADEDAVMRVLLGGFQRTLRRSYLTAHFRRRTHGYHVTVDGPLTNMQSSRDLLPPYMLGLADGTSSALSRRRRVALGRRLLRAYARGVWDMSADVLDAAQRFGLSPNSFVFGPASDDFVQYRLDALTDLLGGWNNGGVASEHVLEEVHATAEVMLGALLGEGWDDRSFAEQADEALRSHHLTQVDHEALIALKTLRRAVRHHRSSIDRPALAAVLADTLPALHRLSAQV